MEAHLCQLGVYRTITGEHEQPGKPDYAVETPAAADTAAIPRTRGEKVLNLQLKAQYQRKVNNYPDCEEKAAGDILAQVSRSQRTHITGLDNRGVGTAIRKAKAIKQVECVLALTEVESAHGVVAVNLDTEAMWAQGCAA
jgi:hypothetical protein